MASDQAGCAFLVHLRRKCYFSHMAPFQARIPAPQIRSRFAIRFAFRTHSRAASALPFRTASRSRCQSERPAARRALRLAGLRLDAQRGRIVRRVATVLALRAASHTKGLDFGPKVCFMSEASLPRPLTVT